MPPRASSMAPALAGRCRPTTRTRSSAGRSARCENGRSSARPRWSAKQDIFYRIRFQDLASPTIVGEPMTGRFRTAPSDQRSISFVWSGDTAGPRLGHRRSARRHAHLTRPCCATGRISSSNNGDNIYADGPILAGAEKCRTARSGKKRRDRGKGQAAETLASSGAN